VLDLLPGHNLATPSNASYPGKPTDSVSCGPSARGHVVGDWLAHESFSYARRAGYEKIEL
jgi:hypothetical protein